MTCAATDVDDEDSIGIGRCTVNESFFDGIVPLIKPVVATLRPHLQHHAKLCCDRDGLAMSNAVLEERLPFSVVGVVKRRVSDASRVGELCLSEILDGFEVGISATVLPFHSI